MDVWHSVAYKRPSWSDRLPRWSLCSDRRDVNDDFLASCSREDRAGISIRYLEEAHETFAYIYQQSSARARLPPLGL